MTDIFQGDDTAAFGQNFLIINATIPEGFSISKADFKCGNVFLTFENPEFPLTINLTSEQTDLLDTSNKCFLAVYDDLGRKKTCTGSLKINTNAKVI